MKKVSVFVLKTLSFVVLCLCLCVSLVACGKEEGNTIVVGASPSPHAEILNSKEFVDFIESKGYKLEVKIYQDYGTLNKALNDEGIDANYFQHVDYLNLEIAEKGFDLAAACQVHNEPLNLYGKTGKEDWSNTKVYIINDETNVKRAFKLLVANGLIETYDVENFDSLHPVYTSSIGVTIECIDAGLLHIKVEEGGYAVIPGNYALTAWGTEKATNYKVFGETIDVALPNIIACRTKDLNSEKINILVEAFAQESIKQFIENTFAPTVNYVYKDLRK